MSAQAVDSGFCPRCNDVIQPEHPEGVRSRKVADILFCVICARYVEDHPAVLEHYVQQAKMGGQL
jgi:trans-aconitate methyltransferase